MAATADERQRFGQRLRELRSERDLTAEQVGASLTEPMSGQNVAAWERGAYAPQRRAVVAELEQIVGASPGELAVLLGYSGSASLDDRVSDLETQMGRVLARLEALADRWPDGPPSDQEQP